MAQNNQGQQLHYLFLMSDGALLVKNVQIGQFPYYFAL